MCSTCGCDQVGDVTITKVGEDNQSFKAIKPGERVSPHLHHDYHADHLPLGGKRVITLEQDVLEKNNKQAGHNRVHFAEQNIFAINLVSSPGSGKTTLLERTLKDQHGKQSFAVIEGDQQTMQDAKRIAATGVPVVQVNTGKGCHLDADMVHRAIHRLEPPDHSVLFIENVGNLVCPALFDLGETARVVIISVTEGDDKPLKYPDMFASSNMCIINKMDLLPYVNFDLASAKEYALRANPKMKFVEVSSTTGEGMEQWYEWLNNQVEKRKVMRAFSSSLTV